MKKPSVPKVRKILDVIEYYVDFTPAVAENPEAIK